MSIYIPPDAAQRAYRNFDSDENGCRISRYSRVQNTKGASSYAQIGWGARPECPRGTTTAHRAAWVHVHGQIPDGMTVDHLCKNGMCVNVDHLRLLSNFENARRTSGRDWPLGQCTNGHPNSELVSRRKGGRLTRNCLICARESNAKWVRENPEKYREAQRRYAAKKRNGRSERSA